VKTILGFIDPKKEPSLDGGRLKTATYEIQERNKPNSEWCGNIFPRIDG